MAKGDCWNFWIIFCIHGSQIFRFQLLLDLGVFTQGLKFWLLFFYYLQKFHDLDTGSCDATSSHCFGLFASKRSGPIHFADETFAIFFSLEKHPLTMTKCITSVVWENYPYFPPPRKMFGPQWKIHTRCEQIHTSRCEQNLVLAMYNIS